MSEPLTVTGYVAGEQVFHEPSTLNVSAIETISPMAWAATVNTTVQILLLKHPTLTNATTSRFVWGRGNEVVYELHCTNTKMREAIPWN